MPNKRKLKVSEPGAKRRASVTAKSVTVKSKDDPHTIALAIVSAWGRQGGKLRWKGVSAADRRAHARYAISVRWSKAKAKKSQ